MAVFRYKKQLVLLYGVGAIMENIWEKYKLVNLIDFFGAEIWDLVLTIQSDSETGDIKAGKRDFREVLIG